MGVLGIRQTVIMPYVIAQECTPTWDLRVVGRDLSLPLCLFVVLFLFLR